MVKKIILFLFLMFTLITGAFAHSVRVEAGVGDGVVIVKSFFSPTSPVAGAAVMIYSPDSQPYQAGRTDARGYFVFMPDTSGEWLFTVDDERGHKGRIAVSIDESFFKVADMPEEADRKVYEEVSDIFTEDKVAADEQIVQGFPLFYRFVFGLAIIFGLTGIFYGVKARQALKRNNT